jgi:hypothetical protein
VKTAQAEDKKVIKWTMDNKTLELTKSGVRHILCVGNPNGTILDLKPKGVTKSTRSGRGGHGRGCGRGGRGSKPTHEEGSSKATWGVSKPTRGGSKLTLTKLHNDAFMEMFNLLKIDVDNNWDLKEEEVDWYLAEEEVDLDEEEQEEVP